MEGSNSNSNNEMASFSLPPGCRFYPSEEQLFCRYLNKKNTNTEEESSPCGYDLIKELDLYQYEPYDLPERACYAYGYRARRRHWYCYSKVRVKKESKCRRAKNGYWRRKGVVRDVIVMNNSNSNNNKNNNGGGKLVLGTKTIFVFYLGNSLKTAVRTDWFMHEYALVDHVKASFVLCRVFVKSRGGNSISEVGLSSGAEESVSAVRHIGIQHDGILKPDFIEAEVHDDNSFARQNDTSRYPGRLDSHLDDHAIYGPDASFHLSPGIPPNEQVSTSGLTGAGMFSNAVAAQQLLSILEDDFIELDDLVP